MHHRPTSLLQLHARRDVGRLSCHIALIVSTLLVATIAAKVGVTAKVVDDPAAPAIQPEHPELPPPYSLCGGITGTTHFWSLAGVMFLFYLNLYGNIYMFTFKKNILWNTPARSETRFGILSEFRSRTNLQNFQKSSKNIFLLAESIKATVHIKYTAY